MGAVKDRANGNSESAVAITTLPPLISTIAANMTADIVTLAIRAYRMPVPSSLFKVVDCLFIGLEGLEKFEGVRGAPFCSMRYHTSIIAFVKSKSVPFRFLLPKAGRPRS
jgi:hypothetical protein